ncbi:hypothetical protein [Aliagarivorans marinus]|uniref:hypothetical protein n=1 Tax=Aliagarivorans marinus TaxID=561965 RepID=UPI00041A78A6|nr:hypothetical protein [Aliagarivorans marinus]
MKQLNLIAILATFALTACGGGGGGGDSSAADNEQTTTQPAPVETVPEEVVEQPVEVTPEPAPVIEEDNDEPYVAGDFADISVSEDFDFAMQGDWQVSVQANLASAERVFLNLCTEQDSYGGVDYASCVWQGPLATDVTELTVTLPGHATQLNAELWLLGSGDSQRIQLTEMLSDSGSISFSF